MTEEQINAFRQADANLREALRTDETERPQMPADLNERLMQRLGTQQEKKSRRTVWPWIAAACVAGVMIVWLTPPKDTTTDVVAEQTPKVETPAAGPTEEQTVDQTPEPVTTIEAVRQAPVRTRKPLLAQATPKAQTPDAEPLDEDRADLAEAVVPQGKTVTLTESDIPITRPENYKYTPEEIALLKRQADEAYLRWAQLEMEIAKNNLEQTAQK